MKIYVASSWRNQFQPAIVELLRSLDHDVYDFRGGGSGWRADAGEGGFSWRGIDGDWAKWTPEQYCEALKHPLSQAGFDRDMDALRMCDVCIFVMPCGPSASMEMGWACGAGKKVAAYIPGLREPDLMVKMADFISPKWSAIEDWLRAL